MGASVVHPEKIVVSHNRMVKAYVALPWFIVDDRYITGDGVVQREFYAVHAVD